MFSWVKSKLEEMAAARKHAKERAHLMKYFSEEHLEQLKARYRFVVATQNRMSSPTFFAQRSHNTTLVNQIRDELDKLSQEKLRLEAEIDVMVEFLNS